MKILPLIILALTVSNSAWAKRMAPAVVDPVQTSTEKIDVEVDRKQCEGQKQDCGMEVFLVAKDLTTDKVAWKSELYTREFKPGVETDAQEIFLKSIKLRKTHVQVRDERNKLYVVDLSSGALVHPKKPIVYPAE